MRSVYETTTEIRVGDTVAVLSGKDAGKRGSVERLVTPGKVVVSGLNIAKKHQKPVKATIQAGIIDKEMPIPVSNIALLCSKCGRTRAGYTVADDGAKARVCKKCGGELPRAKREQTK